MRDGGDLTLLDAGDAPLGTLAVEPGVAGNRMNDGKADPAGRLWFGSMSLTRGPARRPSTGSTPMGWPRSTRRDDLQRARLGSRAPADVLHRLAAQRIDLFDFDVASGAVENRRAFAEIDPADGVPDGLTVDADGGVWVALFGGGAVRRYDPEGALVEALPCRRVARRVPRSVAPICRPCSSRRRATGCPRPTRRAATGRRTARRRCRRAGSRREPRRRRRRRPGARVSGRFDGRVARDRRGAGHRAGDGRASCSEGRGSSSATSTSTWANRRRARSAACRFRVATSPPRSRSPRS